MVTRETKTTVAFVVLAVILWLAASAITDNELVQWGVLIVVGVVVPMALNQRRE